MVKQLGNICRGNLIDANNFSGKDGVFNFRSYGQMQVFTRVTDEDKLKLTQSKDKSKDKHKVMFLQRYSKLRSHLHSSHFMGILLKENWGLERDSLETIGRPSIFICTMIKIGKMKLSTANF